jgi:hypothetical protein
LKPEDESAIARTVAEHVTERVELSWVLPFSDMKGKANLQGISLSPAMISLVRMPPVSWGE